MSNKVNIRRSGGIAVFFEDVTPSTAYNWCLRRLRGLIYEVLLFRGWFGVELVGLSQGAFWAFGGLFVSFYIEIIHANFKLYRHDYIITVSINSIYYRCRMYNAHDNWVGLSLLLITKNYYCSTIMTLVDTLVLLFRHEHIVRIQSEVTT